MGAHVLELGSGTGLVSIALAKLGAHVYATDYEKDTMKNLRFNVHRNKEAGRVQVVRWDWNEELPEQIPLAKLKYCVGSDVAYGSSTTSLCTALRMLKASAPSIDILLLLQERDAQAVQALREELHQAGVP